MTKLFLPAIVVALIASNNCAATDYLLKLAVKQLNEPQTAESASAARTHETVEILVRTGETFYGNTFIGTDRVTIRGRLEESGDGTPRVKLNYRKTSVSNESEPGSRSEELQKTNAIEFKTDAIPMTLGKPVEYDALLTVSNRVRLVVSINDIDRTLISD